MYEKKREPDCGIAGRLLPEQDNLAYLINYFPEKTFYQFSAGQPVFEEDEHATSIYCLLKGTAKASKMIRDKKFTIAVASPGQVFGLQALIEQAPFHCSLITLETCSFCAIRRSDLLHALHHDVVFTLRLMKIMHAEIRLLENNLQQLFHSSISVRTAKLILLFADWFGTDENGLIKTHLELKDIANLLRISDKHLYSVLHLFSKKNHLEVRQKRLSVLNYAGLKEESQAND